MEKALEKIQKRMMLWDQKILDILYPPRCPFCDKVVCGKQRICPKCREKIRQIKEPSCKKCGKPLDNERAEYCTDCQKNRHYFTQGKALWIYEKKVKQSIYRYKYQNKREYAVAYAEEMAKKYGNWMRSMKIEAIVPVPLHKSRRKSRGYNQTEILAKEIGRCMGIPVRTDYLVRVKNTQPQKMLNIAERKNNLKKAFKTPKSIVQSKYVLIVDDIYTTGSTLDSAAQTLLDAGVAKVYVCCISIGKA